MLKKRISLSWRIDRFSDGYGGISHLYSSAAPLGTDKPTMWPQTALTQTTAP